MLMDPYMKGLSISNCDKIRIEHNKFSKPEPFIFSSKKKEADDDEDLFHFVSYIHHKNSIYEIDGLQEGPNLLSDNVKYEEWLEKIKPFILERIQEYANFEIKFNLLAVVPDKKNKYLQELMLNKSKKEYILRKLNKEVEKSNDEVEVKFFLFFTLL